MALLRSGATRRREDGTDLHPRQRTCERGRERRRKTAEGERTQETKATQPVGKHQEAQKTKDVQMRVRRLRAQVKMARSESSSTTRTQRLWARQREAQRARETRQGRRKRQVARQETQTERGR